MKSNGEVVYKFHLLAYSERLTLAFKLTEKSLAFHNGIETKKGSFELGHSLLKQERNKIIKNKGQGKIDSRYKFKIRDPSLIFYLTRIIAISKYRF